MMGKKINVTRVILAIVCVLATGSHVSTVQANNSHNEAYEPSVLNVVKSIQSGDLEGALRLVEEHITEFPKSRVGHLLKADILQAMVYNPTAIADDKPQLVSPLIEPADTTDGLRQQIKRRWQHHNLDQHQTHAKIPANLIDMGRHKYVMVSDMRAGRLYLYINQDGRPELVKDYYLSVGSEGYGKEIEGDNKTPIGVYSIYRHIAGSELPDLYGKGAYPVNYPNSYDRALKRTGYGIWLHGTPSNTYARAPWASEGCFVLSNDDLLDIEQYIDVEGRTPVILAEQVNWITQDELKIQRDRLMKAFYGWKQDWESLDSNAYLSHYSRDNFNFGTKEFKPWAQRKLAVNEAKTFIQIDLEIDSMFLYPGVKDMFVVQYTQRYLSNNYSGQTKKQQYWKKNSEGLWQIISES